MVIIQETSCPFPLWIFDFPITRSFTEPPDNKIILRVFEYNCGMCPTVLPSFTALKLNSHLLKKFALFASMKTLKK